ncbi:Possible FlgD protein [Roseobacter sp. AzwK-3b]|uniref:flagellar hook capping FlgD N-terminal domain-containing protein n=1 Tax=Roseobacter sp. AzwK-3b TaxID=351016 RepID=UPI000156991D|nr:flagellar hook capping FlgD N-terminal domain-containing protein [Roseobacter sp. AzwK-3b]EDM73051.1 Possible FlgD protein [Roseobacter sp. AzwK-3b]
MEPITAPITRPASQGPGSSIPSASANTTAEAPPKPALSSDFETFLKMLTAQMRNQDPLNPVESADFAVQLATFSTVEQQVRTNDLLETLGDRMGAMGMSQLSGWVGMEARAIAPVQLDGAPVTLTVPPVPLADAAQIVARDSTGTIVQRSDVSIEGGTLQWAGVGPNGAPLPSGRYDLAVESFSNGESLGETPVQVHGRIVEARNDAGAITLVLAGGQDVPAESILGLRHPDP